MLLTDSASAARPFQNLTVWSIDPFKVADNINKNVNRVDLPENIFIHSIVHAEHMAKAYCQPPDISTTPVHSAQPFINEHAESVIKFTSILSHRWRGKAWHFLA